jgi:hypothetical protein
MVLTVSILWGNFDQKNCYFHASLWMAKLIIPNLKWMNRVK